MALLQINSSVPLGTFDKIETIHRRSTVSMMQKKHVGVVVNPSVPLGTFNKIGTIQRRSTISMMQRKHVDVVVNPSVPLGTFDKIRTIQRRSTLSCMMQRKKPIGVVSASFYSLSNSRPIDRVAENDDPKKEKITSSRNLDEWMNVSMVDIVKNLKQAPLFVHVYANEDDDDDDDERGQERRRRQLQIKTERAMLEKWPMMKSEWKSGKTRTPDGLIFVQELIDDDEEENEIGNGNGNLLVEDSEAKSWGVIVQGKGIDKFGPACYLLKTSRVRAGRGMDLFCTHFCLVRVKNFRDSALKQFKSCWL